MSGTDRPRIPAAVAHAATDSGVDFPDDAQIATLRETVQRDRTALDRIGLGLRALHNHPLFERLPEDFRQLIQRLQNRERRDPAAD